ncbi:hydroxymethylglutaryl-CoA synthase [Thermoplasmatales archaeon SW_10_69_26]|nr:MAG: hydroxymethylglutaryl-CoA synthase [Thermoplasmatales archaeon SW_10_69_26]
MVGIVSYGAWIPRYRITTEEISRVWGKEDNSVAKGLNVQEKSVPGPDEDTTTLSVEAARQALRRSDRGPDALGAIYIGSESHVYAVKPTATIVAEAIGASPRMTAADFEFACKAGTAAIQSSLGMVSSGMVDTALAIGADTSQGAPGDALEYAASAGAAAFQIGTDDDDIIAEIDHTVSYTTDTPDFWRREGEKYPSHAARFTGEPAYYRHTLNCSNQLLEEAGTEPEDYDYAVFHQPNGKFPVRAAKQLGFSDKQTETGLLAPVIGNTYSGAVLIGLSAILDVARPGSRIFVCGYGSGAGSDAFDLTVTEEMADYRRSSPTVRDLVDDRKEIDYATYAKFRGKIDEGEVTA